MWITYLKLAAIYLAPPCVIYKIILRFISSGESSSNVKNMILMLRHGMVSLWIGWVNQHKPLTRWGRHKMDANSLRIFSKAFSWMKIYKLPKGPINIISALNQIMAWRRPGDKPLSEPMVFRLLTHTCIDRPQWVNILRPGHARVYS